jgi:hypothetical protein
MAVKTIDRYTPKELDALRSDKARFDLILSFERVAEVPSLIKTDTGIDRRVEHRSKTETLVLCGSYPAALAKAFSGAVAKRYKELSDAQQLGGSFQVVAHVRAVAIKGSQDDFDHIKALFKWFFDYCNGDQSLPQVHPHPLVSVVELIRVAKVVQANAVLPFLVDKLDVALRELPGNPPIEVANMIMDLGLDTKTDVLADKLSHLVAKGDILIDSKNFTSLCKKDALLAAKVKARVEVRHAEAAKEAEQAELVRQEQEAAATAALKAEQQKRRKEGPQRPTYSTVAARKDAEQIRRAEVVNGQNGFTAAPGVSAEQNRQVEEARRKDEERIRKSRFKKPKRGGKKDGAGNQGGGGGDDGQAQALI